MSKKRGALSPHLCTIFDIPSVLEKSRIVHFRNSAQKPSQRNNDEVDPDSPRDK